MLSVTIFLNFQSAQQILEIFNFYLETRNIFRLDVQIRKSTNRKQSNKSTKQIYFG